MIEQPSIVEAGRGAFSTYPDLRFQNTPPANSAGKVQIVLMRSALQYFLQPREILEKLSGADFIVLIRLVAGEQQDFVTKQIIQERDEDQHPFWVFNRRKLEIFIEKLGYELLFRCGDLEKVQMPGLPYDFPNTVTMGFRLKSPSHTKLRLQLAISGCY